jgi:hypothetical protein
MRKKYGAMKIFHPASEATIIIIVYCWQAVSFSPVLTFGN